MSVNIENYIPVVQYNGLNTAKAQNITASSGAYNVDYSASTGTFKTSTGAVTIGGATTFNSTVAYTTAPTGPKISTVSQSALVGATVVLTASQSGSTLINRSTSGSPSWTLPAAASGMEFTFICANTTAGFTITTGTASVIHAKTSATGTAITSTATTGSIVNTQATAVVGDALKIVCDGTDWWVAAQTGIFSAT